MPNAVTFGAGQRTLSYGHDANGEKHSVTHISSSGTSVTEYCDNVIYRNGSPAILLTEIGYYSFADGRYHTYIRDWQGNNRVVLRDDGKAVKNPFGAKGKLDHQNKVEELANQAEKELRFGERIETESQIKVGGSKRRPDVQILDKDGKTRKVFEAERHPNSKRNRLREEEYNRLGIEYETHSLN